MFIITIDHNTPVKPNILDKIYENIKNTIKSLNDKVNKISFEGADPILEKYLQ